MKYTDLLLILVDDETKLIVNETNVNVNELMKPE